MKLGSLLSVRCRHRSMKSSSMEGHTSLSTALVLGIWHVSFTCLCAEKPTFVLSFIYMCDIIWPPAPLKSCYLARNLKKLHAPALRCSVGVVDGMPRAGSHYNLGTARGPDKIGSRAGPGPRAASCTWLIYMKDRYDINPFFTSVFILEAIVKITAIGVMIYMKDRYDINPFFTSVFILEAIVKITALGVMIYMKDRYDINPFFTSVFILEAIVKITALGVMIYMKDRYDIYPFFTSVFILEAIVKITALRVMIYMKDRYDINPFFTSVFILVAIVKITALGVMIYMKDRYDIYPFFTSVFILEAIVKITTLGVMIYMKDRYDINPFFTSVFILVAIVKITALGVMIHMKDRYDINHFVLSYVYIRTKSQNRCDSCTYIYVHGLYDRNVGLLLPSNRHFTLSLHEVFTCFRSVASISQHVYQVGRKVEFTRSLSAVFGEFWKITIGGPSSIHRLAWNTTANYMDFLPWKWS